MALLDIIRRPDVPDEQTAIRRGLKHAYETDLISLAELEAGIEAVERGDTFAHMPAEPFDGDDDRNDCVVCGAYAMSETIGGGSPYCPACGTSTTYSTLRARGIVEIEW